MVVSPTHDLVYANASAKQVIDDCPLLEQVREGGVFEHRSQPCEACPGKNVLELGNFCQEAGHAQPSESIAPTCPFPKALPLVGTQEHIRCVLMLGRTGRETMVLHSSVKGSFPLVKEKVVESNPLDVIVGKSEAMQQVFDTIRLVATSQATVLLQGESGTGKELVAKTIHQLGPRREAPFIVIDCGAMPETLLESELFGHRRGAFTGAVADRKGLFEEAEGGTIFLDEIANTSTSFQAKLLRVLQEGEVKPVGGNHPTKVDVRIISASNIPLEQLIEAQTFRTDLFYRLAVLPITLPPLRDRQEDIPLLVHTFIRRACQKHHKDEVGIAPDAILQLTQRTWLGNVRELEHAIERLVLTTQGPCIQASAVEESPDSISGTPDLYQMRKLAQSRVEKDMIVKALGEANGNKVLAAKLLSISRATLYNKIKAYNIS